MHHRNKSRQYAGYTGDNDVDKPRIRLDLDGRARSYRSRLSALEDNRRLVEHDISRLNNERTQILRANAPVCKLPCELLGMIFWLVNAPLRISLVCRYWFAVAYCMGSLWSTIVINTADVSDYIELGDMMDTLKRYITRSNIADLTLRINVDDIHEPDAFSCFAGMLQPALYRVISFTLTVHSTQNPSDITDVLYRLGPRLRNLKLEVESFREHHIIPLPPSSTSLRSLRLCSKDSALAYSPGSYPNLEDLEVDTGRSWSHMPSDWATVMSLLQQTPLLKTLTIQDGDFNQDNSFGKVVLHHLHKITMISMENSSMEWVLGRLTLPGLRSLVVRRNRTLYAPFTPDLPDFTAKTERRYDAFGNLKAVEDVIWSMDASQT